MQRDIIYYSGEVEFNGNLGEQLEVLGAIVGKDYYYFLIETFNKQGDVPNNIRPLRMHDRVKCPKLKRKGLYLWIHERYYNDFKFVGKQTR